jgi:tetratricopeptide (TPR) repeat protein
VERRFPVHARAHRQALIVALALVSSTAVAAPKGAAAKKAFDKGVKAYTAGDYDAAAAAMKKSYELETDPETLFAWAQSERKLEHCDKAIELYNELLVYDLPAENKQVIDQQVGECKDILAAKQPPPKEEPTTEPEPPPPAHDAMPAEPPPETQESRPWWKDPIGDGLVLTGVAGLVVGGIELSAAAGADSNKTNATSYTDFKKYSDQATSVGRTGVIAASAGAALVTLGVIWYATHREHHEHAVTGWLAPTGGGIALTGGF